MRILIQRVLHAKVVVDSQTVSEIGKGLLLFAGVGAGDTRAEAEFLAEKCAFLRIFEDSEGKTNLSIQDVKGEALVVSQFTLYADARKGRRPSFTDAALPATAEPLVNHFAQKLESFGISTRLGKFGAHMEISLLNDGPFTIFLEQSPA